MRNWSRLLVLGGVLWCLPCAAGENTWFQELIDRLDPASPATSALAEVPAPGDRQAKIQLLAHAMRSRVTPRPLWVIPLPQKIDPAYDTGKADDAVIHRIHSQYGSEQFGDTLPWFSPGKRVQTIARFPHFDDLAPAYFHTGDERYARAMVRDMVDFIEHVPIERATWVNPQSDPSINPWNWVLQHWRIMRWIDALAFLRESPSLPDSTYLKITLHLWKEAEWLLPRMQLGLHNSTLGNIRAMLYVGLHFPESSASHTWYSTSAGMFRFFIDTYFYPGEVSIELTLGYSSAVLGQCLMIYASLPDSAARSALALPLQALVEGHLGLMKPDRSLPRYGDHGDFDFTRSVLVQAAELFQREDWAGLLQETEQGPAFLSYPPRSVPYYLSGYYAMRDGWSRDAQFLSMDAGPFGTNHQHGDKLSITLSADGAAFIVDPGTAIYRSTRNVTLYDLRPGFLHNTITVDGIDPSAGYDQHYQFDVMENRWITAAPYDFLDGVYDYRASGREAMARRSVLYVRGEYWIVLDAVYGQGPAHIENNLQFMVGTALALEDRDVVARAPNGATLHLASAEDELVLSVVEGDTVFPGTTFPFRYGKNLAWRTGGRGWVGGFGNHSADMHSVDAAPALLLHGDVPLPHFSLRLLSPSRGLRARPLEVEWLGRQEEAIRARISRGPEPVVDYFQWHPGAMPPIYERPDAEGGWWMRAREGSLEMIILVHCRELDLLDDGLGARVRFSAPVDGSARRQASGWALQLDSTSAAGLHLEAFEVRDRGSASVRFVTSDGGELIFPGEQRLLPARP